MLSYLLCDMLALANLLYIEAILRCRSGWVNNQITVVIRALTTVQWRREVAFSKEVCLSHARQLKIYAKQTYNLVPCISLTLSYVNFKSSRESHKHHKRIQL